MKHPDSLSVTDCQPSQATLAKQRQLHRWHSRDRNRRLNQFNCPISVRNLRHEPVSRTLFCCRQLRIIMSPWPKNLLQSLLELVLHARSPRLRMSSCAWLGDGDKAMSMVPTDNAMAAT